MKDDREMREMIPTTITTKEVVAEVIQYWKERGRDSGTFLALNWLQSRVDYLEAEIKMTEAKLLDQSIRKAMDASFPTPPQSKLPQE